MTWAYFNYPQTHISAHRSSRCGEIQKMHKAGQRCINVDLDSLGAELRRFESCHYRFASHAGANDMWVVLDLGDVDLERAVLEFVRKRLARRYTPFGAVVVPPAHC